MFTSPSISCYVVYTTLVRVRFFLDSVAWFTLILHFSFAIVFSILFVALIQNYKQVAMGQGAVYGLVLWVVWHVILMPALGTVPAPWDQPLTEHFPEIFGHIIWGWSIAATVYFLIAKDKKETLRNF